MTHITSTGWVGDSVLAVETGGDDGLERANPDDARSIGLAVQNSRAGKSWWQGETDTEHLKRLWCCVVFFWFLAHFVVNGGHGEESYWLSIFSIQWEIRSY